MEVEGVKMEVAEAGVTGGLDDNQRGKGVIVAICEQHENLVNTITEISKQMTGVVTSLAVLNATFTDVKNRMSSHISDGEKEGGFRDRLVILEQKQKVLKDDVIHSEERLCNEISVIKKGYWKACIVSGIIGGMIGNTAPGVFVFISKLIGF